MFKFLKDRKKKDNKGFTLVELVIVVAILAILVGILAPQYTKYVEKSRKSADASNLENMTRALEITAADATDALAPDTYHITITNSATNVTADSNTTANINAAKKAITDTVGNDALATELKSKHWANKNEIQATVEIDSNYTVTVSYSPDELITFVGKNKVTNTDNTDNTDNTNQQG